MNKAARCSQIGHSTRTLAELVAILKSHDVSVLADVRTVPRSRHVPQFNAETLAGDLVESGIKYMSLPALGGLRKAKPDSVNTAWRNASFRGYADYMQTPAFRAGLDQLIQIASAKPTAIMCAEGRALAMPPVTDRRCPDRPRLARA